METVDPIAEGRATAIAFNGPEGSGFKNNGLVNTYTCEACGERTVTVDREPGVTPFLTACPECNGLAQSAGYRVQQTLRPTHEWYRPESIEGLNANTVEHLRAGGPILRRIMIAGLVPAGERMSPRAS